MKVLFFVLNKVDKLNALLNEFANKDVTGATIMNSHGMAHSLYDSDDHHAFASFRLFLDPKRKESKTIMMVIKDEEQDKVLECIEKVIGNLDKPDTGIIFTMPVDFIKGLNR